MSNRLGPMLAPLLTPALRALAISALFSAACSNHDGDDAAVEGANTEEAPSTQLIATYPEGTEVVRTQTDNGDGTVTIEITATASDGEVVQEIEETYPAAELLPLENAPEGAEVAATFARGHRAVTVTAPGGGASLTVVLGHAGLDPDTNALDGVVREFRPVSAAYTSDGQYIVVYLKHGPTEMEFDGVLVLTAEGREPGTGKVYSYAGQYILLTGPVQEPSALVLSVEFRTSRTDELHSVQVELAEPTDVAARQRQ